MSKIYCISGLGADGRIFRNLKIRNASLVPLSWPHYDEHDDMQCYAQKLMYAIGEEEPVILGVSFGGMLAVEIMKQYAVRKAFLISSAKTKYELPFAGKFLRLLTELRLIPVGLFRHFRRQMYERFGAFEAREQQLLQSILDDTDHGFVKWSMNAIMNWRNETVPENIVHIHGTDDRMIAPDNVHPDYWISGGTHFMVYNKAGEISEIINCHL